jgi:hypothetical protein
MRPKDETEGQGWGSVAERQGGETRCWETNLREGGAETRRRDKR